MYFTTADGKTSVDVVMDRLNMCHVLDFHDRIDRLPDTLDVADLLLTKLQVVELNRKDVHDILHLFSAFPVTEGDEPGTIGTDRVGALVGEDWGWWRTATMNLEKVILYAEGRPRTSSQRNPVRPLGPGEDAPRRLQRHAEDPEVEAPGQGRGPGAVVPAPEEVGH